MKISMPFAHSSHKSIILLLAYHYKQLVIIWSVYAWTVLHASVAYLPYALCTLHHALHCLLLLLYLFCNGWPANMGLVPFWQPSTLFCRCHLVLHIFCCIVENKPSLSLSVLLTLTWYIFPNFAQIHIYLHVQWGFSNVVSPLVTLLHDLWIATGY